MTKTSIADEIAAQSFFAGLEPQAIAFLAGHARQHAVTDGSMLFCHGQHADRFYLLCRGTVSIEITAIQGPPLELQKLGVGKIAGWSWLIPPYKWHFQARAEEPCEVIEFDGTAILAHCEQDQKFGYELLKRFSTLMSRRLEYARAKMMDAWSPPGFG